MNTINNIIKPLMLSVTAITQISNILTQGVARVYSKNVAANSATRISTLNTGVSKTPFLYSVFFCACIPHSLVGCMEPRKRAEPVFGSANSVQPATLRLVPSDGSSYSLNTGGHHD